MKYLTIILVVLTTTASAQYRLALNLPQGSVYRMQIHSSATFTASPDGKPMNGVFEMTGVLHGKVIATSDSTYTLQMTPDSMQFALKSAMGKIEFTSGDSSGADNGMSGHDKSFSVIVLKNGSVKSIKPADTAGMNAMMRNFPMLDRVKHLLAMMPQKGHHRHMSKQDMQMLTAVFPNKPVGLNETWGSTIKMDSALGKSIRTKYQLTAYSGCTATITGEREALGNSQKADAEITGKTTSTFRINSATGWIISGDMRTSIKGTIKGMGSHQPTPFSFEVKTEITGN